MLSKIQGNAPRAPNRSLASSEGISPGSANSRGTAQGVYPGSMGTPRGRSGASAPPAAAEVRLLPDLERSLPSSSSGRARPPPPAAHRLSGVNNYFFYFFFFRSSPAVPVRLTFEPRTQFSSESVGSGGDGARSLPGLAAGPRGCRVSRHTPASPGGLRSKGQRPRGVPLPPKPPRRGGALRPQPAGCGTKSHYEAKCKGS